MLFRAETPVKYRGRRIEIGEEVEAFKKDKEVLEMYGIVTEVDEKEEKAKKEDKKEKEKK